MDCEWEPPFDGASESAVSTLQVALPDGTAYLFHLQRGATRSTPSTFNRSLKTLLNDERITKASRDISHASTRVGVAVKGDGKRLQRDYSVETRGMVDLGSHARACWVDLPCRSLAGWLLSVYRRTCVLSHTDEGGESDVGSEDESSDDDTLDESGPYDQASSGGRADAVGAGADAGEAGADATSQVISSGSPCQEEPPDMFGVRLDLFHALNRISRKIRKKHGAFKPFMARLRDACFLVNRDDIREAMEKVLEARGMTPE
ncbi:unnamed protein product [Ectocarpus sp. 8 AP-2014]